MHYLYRPTQVEELIVRGRYDFYIYNKDGQDGSIWGTEEWERYRNSGSPVQTWRSEWHDQRQGMTLLTHSVVSPDGIERLKLRLKSQQQQQNLTLTPMFDSIMIHDDKQIDDLALPPYYGIVTELPSLVRFAFPFDLASEQRELAMTFLLRLEARRGRLAYRLTKFGYKPLGLQELSVKGQILRCKGWRMEVPGLPTQEGWFDRHGTCLLWRVHQGASSYEARLTEWLTFA